MASCRELRGISVVVLLASLFVAVTSDARGSAATLALSSDGQQIGQVLSVRKVLRTPYFTSRYPQIHYYSLYFAVRAADQTYCGEYETPVLDEISDLFLAKGKDVEIVLERRSFTLRTPTGRKIKARLVEPGQC